MKWSVSNIAWSASTDEAMYRRLHDAGCSGLEIAPTRIFPESPYTRLAQAKAWAERLKHEYGLAVPSMQSIWYGRSENIFADPRQRQTLVAYTKAAIEFAEAVGCRNLVFGCPRNRDSATPEQSIAIDFFEAIGDYAHKHNTIVAMEANPTIYNTRYINTTTEAIALCRAVGSAGFKLNLDLGTMIYNGEGTDTIIADIDLINHVHISEPYLKPIEPRPLHGNVLQALADAGYQGFVSIEMGNTGCLDPVVDAIEYTKRLIKAQ